MGPVRKIADELWSGVAIVPTMSTGATDGRFLNAAGIPTYGLSGMFHDAEGSHAHGLNERLRVSSANRPMWNVGVAHDADAKRGPAPLHREIDRDPPYKRIASKTNSWISVSGESRAWISRARARYGAWV